MAITLADFNKIWASASPLTPYSFSESNYKQGWNFVGSTPPARQMWDFLQKQNDEKMQYLANNYLPLNGGTMTGVINREGIAIQNTRDDSWTAIAGGEGSSNGAFLRLNGIDNVGSFTIIARDSNGNSTLDGKPNGTLTWSENAIITASNSQTTISRKNTTGVISVFSGSAYNQGGHLSLYGKDNSTHAAGFVLGAHNGTESKYLEGFPNGTLKWGGQPIQTSSDKRIKQDFADVPADVLEAWGKVNWQQFKYKADVEQKGDSCRFHTGLVAQDVKEVGEENNVDLLKYGILCHDVREAVEEEKDENGNVIREASEAVDLWTVRYEEALAMEVIYLRNEIKKLREEISKLK